MILIIRFSTGKWKILFIFCLGLYKPLPLIWIYFICLLCLFIISTKFGRVPGSKSSGPTFWWLIVGGVNKYFLFPFILMFCSCPIFLFTSFYFLCTSHSISIHSYSCPIHFLFLFYSLLIHCLLISYSFPMHLLFIFFISFHVL